MRDPNTGTVVVPDYGRCPRGAAAAVKSLQQILDSCAFFTEFLFRGAHPLPAEFADLQALYDFIATTAANYRIRVNNTGFDAVAPSAGIAMLTQLPSSLPSAQSCMWSIAADAAEGGG